MSDNFDTEQEAFWAGKFGDEHSSRNSGDALIQSNIALFSEILAKCPHAQSLIEFGANTGLNLRAIHDVKPEMELHAIEINESAVRQLKHWGRVESVHYGSILDFRPDEKRDIALIKGVLIHINPDSLQQVYQSLYGASDSYIVLVEYYNPTPVEVSYRGYSNRLFKRDLAGELMDMYPSLCLVDYGFVWHRDQRFPQDDLTWFVLEKTG